MREALVLVCLQLLAGSGAQGQTVREVLLREARTRLTTWYEDKAALNLPYWSGNANVQLTKDNYRCDAKGGDGRMPVTFGEFNVSDASPRDVFSALTDPSRTLDWDTSLASVAPLGHFREEGVLGMNILLASGIVFVPPRELFEWMAYNASEKDQEYWLAYTSLENEQLHDARERDASAVPMQNCLGAYWIRPCPVGGELHSNCPSSSPFGCCPDGGSRVIYTQHVNVHPPSFLPPRVLFDASWYRQIDWVNTLRGQAQMLKRKGEARLVMPDWMLKDALAPSPSSRAPPGSLGASIARLMPKPPSGLASSGFFELPGTITASRSALSPLPFAAVLAGLVVFAALIPLALARPLRRRGPSVAAFQQSRQRRRGADKALIKDTRESDSGETLLSV